MLAVARQGRVLEARTFREQYLQEVSYAEAVYGKLDDRLQRDDNEKSIYDQASRGVRQGTISRGDPWWTENQQILERTERRYGKLLQSAVNEDIRTQSLDKGTKTRRLKRWLPIRKQESESSRRSASHSRQTEPG